MSKRKAAGGGGGANKKAAITNTSPATSSATLVPYGLVGENDAPVTITLEQQLELEISKLKDGTHPDLISKTGDLVKAKEKSLNAADRHRKLLIKNINELYDFEIQDAEALFQKSYTDIQEKLIADVRAEAQRLKALASASTKTASSASQNGTAGSENAKSGESVEEQRNRALRSSGEDVSLIASQLREKIVQRRPKAATPAPPPVVIQRSLPEHAVREDFLEIVKDIEARAVLFANAAAASVAAMAKSTESQNSSSKLASVSNGTLTIGNDVFRLGDSVVVSSLISQESLLGVITAISPTDFVIRGEKGLGPRFAFHLGQLKEGRVTISRDYQTDTAQKTIKA